MKFEVFIDVKGDWLSLGHWVIDCSIAACNPYDLANAFLDSVADALNTPAQWEQDGQYTLAYPKRPSTVAM